MAGKTYDGAEISVHFDMSRCIHARNCFLKLPTVFDPAQRPWIQPDNASAEEVAAMIRTCPSGALTFSRPGTEEHAPGVNRIAVLENGPLAAHADLDGGTTRATLCRCGLSKNKPYCDYSHVDGDFQATGEPKPTVPATAEPTVGALSLAPIPDGPLKIDGPVEITTGTGRRIGQHDKAFLCRCGASQNKPYCDGTHNKIGFKTEA